MLQNDIKNSIEKYAYMPTFFVLYTSLLIFTVIGLIILFIVEIFVM